MKRFKQLCNVLIDGIKIIHHIDKWKIPLLMLRALASSAIPFVVIVMSAEIINRLSAGAEFRETLTYALTSVGAIFALSVLSGWLKKVNDVKSNHCRRLYDYSKNEKMMTMDYSELESPASNSLRTKLNAEENIGFGLPLLFTCLDTLSESILTAVLSLAFFLPVVYAADGLPAAGLAAFILLSIALSLVASLFRKRVDDQYLKRVKDDSFWGDAFMQSEAMVYGGTFTYKSGKDVRIYGFQDAIRARLDESMRFLLSNAKAFATTPALTSGAVGAVRGLIMGGSYIFVAAFASGGGMALGTVILLASILYQFTFGISQAIAISATMFSVTESLQMYVQFTSTPDRQYKGTLPVEKRADREYEIEFCGVSFKYPGSEAYALRNLDIKFNIGKRMAVVGMNGSGKTTMIKLLCRLYDPTEGEILLNGVNIKKYDPDEYRSIFSVVFQDFKLLSLELGQVLSASGNYDQARATDCLRLAGFGERLAAMPDGVKTAIYKDFEDGVEISGGEAQKVAMARALYKDAPFIVLDEPTAALDPISEFEVYSKFNDIIGDKTAIFISHRLSSCRFCDDIAVFHEGALIQRGGHDELVADGDGKYYELWNAQAQYYSQRT